MTRLLDNLFVHFICIYCYYFGRFKKKIVQESESFDLLCRSRQADYCDQCSRPRELRYYIKAKRN